MIKGHVKHLPKEPMVLITEIFKGGDLFFAERLKQEGEQVLLEAQSYWMSLLLPSLSSYFGIEEITISYDEEVPLSPVFFSYNESIIASFSPYWRTFEEYGIPQEAELLEQRRSLVKQLEEKEKEVEYWVTCEENPALMGEDDTWLFAKASLNPKKYKKKAREMAIQKQNECQQLHQMINSVDFKVEKAGTEYLQTSYYLDRIKSRVARWDDFVFYEPVKEEE